VTVALMGVEGGVLVVVELRKLGEEALWSLGEGRVVTGARVWGLKMGSSDEVPEQHQKRLLPRDYYWFVIARRNGSS